nr:DUF1833 family protein [Methylobacterium brachythecii]
MEESYASGDDEGVEVVGLAIDHPSFPAPVYMVRDVANNFGNPGDTIGLPIAEGGPKLPHLLLAFTVIRPGADRDGPTDGKLQIDGASDEINALLEGTIGYDEEIRVSLRFYRVLPGQLDAVTGPDDDGLNGLLMTEVAIDATQASGTIAWPDGRNQNVPTGDNAFFDRDNYPALFS